MYKPISNNPKIVGIFFIFFSVIFIAIGSIVMMYPKIKSHKCTETVTAEVVENLSDVSHHSSVKKHRSHSSVVYRPVFAFTYEGKDYRITSHTASNPPAFDVGEMVELKIDPDDPKSFYAPADKTTKIIGIIFVSMGSVFLIMGIIFVIVFSRAKKGKPSSIECYNFYQNNNEPK